MQLIVFPDPPSRISDHENKTQVNSSSPAASNPSTNRSEAPHSQLHSHHTMERMPPTRRYHPGQRTSRTSLDPRWASSTAGMALDMLRLDTNTQIHTYQTHITTTSTFPHLSFSMCVSCMPACLCLSGSLIGSQSSNQSLSVSLSISIVILISISISLSLPHTFHHTRSLRLEAHACR